MSTSKDDNGKITQEAQGTKDKGVFKQLIFSILPMLDIKKPKSSKNEKMIDTPLAQKNASKLQQDAHAIVEVSQNPVGVKKETLIEDDTTNQNRPKK